MNNKLIADQENRPLNIKGGKIRQTDIPADGIAVDIHLSTEENQQIADLLDLISLEKTELKVKIDPKPQKRCFVHGALKAAIQQTCVVTLEPVDTLVDERIETEYWPQEQIEDIDAIEINELDDGASSQDFNSNSALIDRGPEPLIDETIDLGQLLYETLATTLDPYPRKAGAVFDWRENDEEKDDGAHDNGKHPFAALKGLKRTLDTEDENH